ncbi:MAG: hypothetical protein JXQ75_23980 [Phycisphaerae bacterium]|nr:hypothetical protein [Phycisphaerae bacterium]
MKRAVVIALCIPFAFAVTASAVVLLRQLGLSDGLILRGSASRLDDFIRLTPSAPIQNGSVWLMDKQDVAEGFSTMFTFRITDPGDVFPDEVTPDTGGDGFAFVIQNAGTDVEGGAGGGIGYAGIPNSIAVEFDTWDNDESGHRFVKDVNHNHVSVHTMGIEPNCEFESYSLGTTPNIPEMTDGDAHTVRIEYVPGNLYVYMDDFKTPILAVELFLDEVLELDEGKAWVGFTAATWDAFENHDILTWAFTSAAE